MTDPDVQHQAREWTRREREWYATLEKRAAFLEHGIESKIPSFGDRETHEAHALRWAIALVGGVAYQPLKKARDAKREEFFARKQEEQDQLRVENARLRDTIAGHKLLHDTFGCKYVEIEDHVVQQAVTAKRELENLKATHRAEVLAARQQGRREGIEEAANEVGRFVGTQTTASTISIAIRALLAPSVGEAVAQPVDKDSKE